MSRTIVYVISVGIKFKQDEWVWFHSLEKNKMVITGITEHSTGMSLLSVVIIIYYLVSLFLGWCLLVIYCACKEGAKFAVDVCCYVFMLSIADEGW